MPSTTESYSLQCFFCEEDFAFGEDYLCTEIPQKDPLNFMRDHLICYHKFPMTITTREIRYILDLILKKELSKKMNNEKKSSFKSQFPYELHETLFYERQLEKIFIHFICPNPTFADIPDEFESNLYPRELDKAILQDKEPPSQLSTHDKFYIEYQFEFWITNELHEFR